MQNQNQKKTRWWLFSTGRLFTGTSWWNKPIRESGKKTGEGFGMINGIYQTAAGMLSLTQMQEVVANNLANVTTNGFKKELLKIEQTNSARQQTESLLSLKPGAMQITENPLQMALSSDGYFTVNTPAGAAYTRNGDFHLTAEGRLVTGDGCPVQGTNGDIVLESQKFTISQSGEIVVEGKVVDQLQINQCTGNMQRLGNSLLLPTDSNSIKPMAPEDVQTMQGVLESSNVNIIESMVDMINITRWYEAGQKIMQEQDAAMKQAASEVGRNTR
jgi:flagellar basal-body rod protein FlgF